MVQALGTYKDKLNYAGQDSNNLSLYSSSDANSDFKNSVFSELSDIRKKYKKVDTALNSVNSVVVLKDADSSLTDDFESTKKDLDGEAKDAYGFLSKDDKAIVIIEDNHKRKPEDLEGSLDSQGQDTLTHEVGHLVGNDFSQTTAFKKAYYADLKDIEKRLKDNPDDKDLKDELVYLKHYMEGVNFEDGIDENDITSRGLKENFAECFSTTVDEHPSKINGIYSDLFKNSMAATKKFIV